MIERQTPPALWRTIAAVCFALGLAGSLVSAKLLGLGLQAAGGPEWATSTMSMVGYLFVGSEAVLALVIGLLPKQQRALKAWLMLAVFVLVSFAVANIVDVQAGISSRVAAGAQANETRAHELRAAIEVQRAIAQKQVDAGRLTRAERLNAETLALGDELAKAEAARVGTAAGVFGQTGAVALNVVRAALLSCAGLVMLGVSGVLLRMGQAETPMHQQAAPAIAKAAKSLADKGPGPEQLGVPTGSTPPVPSRFEQVRAGVLSGELKPSVRAIQSAFGGSTEPARQALVQLCAEGIIDDLGPGRGYRLIG